METDKKGQQRMNYDQRTLHALSKNAIIKAHYNMNLRYTKR